MRFTVERQRLNCRLQWLAAMICPCCIRVVVVRRRRVLPHLASSFFMFTSRVGNVKENGIDSGLLCGTLNVDPLQSGILFRVVIKGPSAFLIASAGLSASVNRLILLITFPLS
jgi:hypothetical protein